MKQRIEVKRFTLETSCHTYNSNKVIKVLSLDVNNDVWGAAEFNFLQLVDPVGLVNAQLSNLEAQLLLLVRPNGWVGQLYEIAHAIGTIRLRVQNGHILPSVVDHQVDDGACDFARGRMQIQLVGELGGQLLVLVGCVKGRDWLGVGVRPLDG